MSQAPCRLIVPYAPGGPIDVTARALAERVRDSLGPVIVENRPSAGGNIGAFMKGELAKYERVVKASGARVD